MTCHLIARPRQWDLRAVLSYAVPFGALIPLILTPFPPIQDLPAIAALFQGFWQPGQLWETGRLTSHSWLFYLLGACLSHISNPWSAALVLLGLSVVAFPMVCASLARARGCDPLLASLAATSMTWNTPLVMGFLPFSLSLSASLAGVAIAFGNRSIKRCVLAALVFAVLTYELHVLGLVSFAICWFVMMPRGRRIYALVPFALFMALSFGRGHGV